MFLELLGILLVFIVILVLAYFTTKFVGKKVAGGAKNKTMRIVESLPLGMDKCLYLILVGKKYFLFYSGRKGMEFVSEIKLDEQTEDVLKEEDDSTNVFEFQKIFENYSGLSPKGSQDKGPVLIDEEADSKSGGILGGIKRLQKINDKKK